MLPKRHLGGRLDALSFHPQAYPSADDEYEADPSHSEIIGLPPEGSPQARCRTMIAECVKPFILHSRRIRSSFGTGPAKEAKFLVARTYEQQTPLVAHKTENMSNNSICHAQNEHSGKR